MFQLTVVTVLAAAEGAHAAEEGIPAWVWGVSIFIVLLGLLLTTVSYANRSLSPEAGQHEDPADLPADERALLGDYAAKRHG